MAITFPIVVAGNIGLFIVAFSYAFSFEGDRPGWLLSICGPIATVIAYPVVLVQNAVPLGRPEDTIVGVSSISLIETVVIALAFQLFSKWQAK